MNLLGAKLYDPTGGAVSKVTTSLLAMTALDTTNLRIAFTIPAHGMVTVKMSCVHHGSTTTAQMLLGVLEGSTLRGRMAAGLNLLGTAIATTLVRHDVEYTLTGLTPGAVNWDAAYGVEIVSSAGGAIKYGGPNDTTTNNGFGAFRFEVWDPQPLPTAAPGAANGVQIAGSNAATTYATLTSTGALTVNGVSAVSQTGDAFARLGAPAGASVSADVAAIQAKTVNLPASPASTTNITAGTISTVTNLTNAPTAGDLTATMKTSVTTAATAATPTAAAVTGNVGGNVVGSVASVTADVGITQAAADKVWASAARTLTGFGTLVADIATAVWGAATRILTAGTNIALAKGTGLTGLNDIAATAIVSGGAITTSAGKVSGVALVDTITTYTGNTPQTGDSFARIGAAGAGLTGLGDARLANLDATVGSRLPSASYTAPDNAGISSAAADAATAAAGASAIYARIGAPVGASISADVAGVQTTATAIKAKTDSLAFTVAGTIDANVQAVNNETIIGTGAPGDLFRV